MKTKLLLGLLPAILALSSCAGVAPKDEVENFEFFQEDTLIHNELFDDSQSVFLAKAIKNLAPVDSSEPRIGVQKSTAYTYKDKSCVAIRFVAAVNLPNIEEASVQWDRAVYTDSGSVHNSISGLLDVEKAYTTISDDNGDVSISSYPGYTHFVTYTVRNVPVANENYVVTASLTVNGISNNKTVATSIDLSRQVAFPNGTTGYFLAGTFNGQPGVVKNQDLLRGGNDKAAFARYIRRGDSFLAVHAEENYFKIYSNEINANNTLFSRTNNKIVAESDGDRIFYFSNDGNLYSGQVWFYLAGDMNNWVETTEQADGYIFSYDDESDSYKLPITFGENRKFAIRARVDGNQKKEWWQNREGWLNSGFTIANDGNIVITSPETYTLRLFLNDTVNPVGIEKEGFASRKRDNITNIYVRGTAVGGEQPTDDTYLFVESADPTYRCELRNVRLNEGFFKVSTCGNYNYERWQWDSYYLNGTRINEAEAPQGNAHHNQINCWDYTNWDIQVLTAGRYDFFIVKENNKMLINYLGE